jgi:trigger factor
MIAYNQDKMLEEFSQRLMYQGLQLDQYLSIIKTTRDDFKAQIRPDAIARIKSSLVLEAVAKKENITVTDEELDEEIQKMADSYQMKVEELKDMMGDKESDSIRKDLAARAALKFLADNAKEV